MRTDTAIYYVCVVILAIAALAGTYFHVLPDSSAFTAIVSFLIGHGVTIISTQEGKRQLPLSSPS